MNQETNYENLVRCGTICEIWKLREMWDVCELWRHANLFPKNATIRCRFFKIFWGWTPRLPCWPDWNIENFDPQLKISSRPPVTRSYPRSYKQQNFRRTRLTSTLEYAFDNGEPCGCNTIYDCITIVMREKNYRCNYHMASVWVNYITHLYDMYEVSDLGFL